MAPKVIERLIDTFDSDQDKPYLLSLTLNRTILATLASIFCFILLTIIITNVAVDPYIKATNWGVNLFDFYENNKEPNKIYILGSSPTIFAADPMVVQNKLHENNQSFNIYSTAWMADLPIYRIFELDKIVESKPKIVVICFADTWLYHGNVDSMTDYLGFRFGLVSDKIQINSFEKSIYNETELGLFKFNSLYQVAYKKQYFIPGMMLLLSNFGILNYKPQKERGFDLFDFKNQIVRV